MKSRIQVRNIKLTRVDDPSTSAIVNSFSEADKILKSLANQPRQGVISNVDYIVTFDDWKEFKGICDLKNYSSEMFTPDLAQYINEKIQEEIVGNNYESRQKALAFLNKYNLVAPPPKARVIFSRSNYINDIHGSGASFWSNEDGWTTIDGATLFQEDPETLPVIGMPENDVCLMDHPGIENFYVLEVLESGENRPTMFQTWAKDHVEADQKAGQAFRGCTIMTPRYRLVSLESTKMWTDDIQAKAGRIFDIYLYNANVATHLAELTPSYALYPLYSEALREDEAMTELLIEGQEGDVLYVHCNQIDRLPYDHFYDIDYIDLAREFEDSEEEQESLIENYKCNRHLGVPASIFSDAPDCVTDEQSLVDQMRT